MSDRVREILVDQEVNISRKNADFMFNFQNVREFEKAEESVESRRIKELTTTVVRYQAQMEKKDHQIKLLERRVELLEKKVEQLENQLKNVTNKRSDSEELNSPPTKKKRV